MKKPTKFEKSSVDKKMDKREAGKRGIPLKKWEGSPADERMDKAAMRKFKRK